MSLTIPATEPLRLGAAPEGASVVLVSAQLLLELVDKANPGARITVVWGEPQEPRIAPWQRLYEPTFTRHDQTHDELHEAIHNTCTKPIHEGES